MAGKNDVVANVRIQIGGVEASKKNMEAIRVSADSLKNTLADLVKQRDAYVATNDLANADKTVKKIRETEVALKATQQLYKSLEKEVGNYENVLENLSGTTMQKLGIAARNLQQQMKQQLTTNDIGRWKQLSDAYKEVMQTIEQLNGKVPNLGYVMQNLGTVSAKSLKDSDEYLKRLIADTDQGSSKLTELQAKLRQVQAEQQARLQSGANVAIGDVSSGSFNGNTQQAKEAIATLEKYKETLNLTTQTDEINRVTKAMEVYNSALGKVQKTAVDVAAVLNDPKSFSTEQIQDAIKQLEEQGKQVKIGDAAQIKETNEQIKKLQQAIADIGKLNPDNIYDNLGISNSNDIQQAIKQYEELSKTVQYGGSEWEEYTTRIDKMKSHLAQATEEMKRNELQVKAQQAILNSDRAQSPGTGASLISAQEAKESIRLIEQYKDGLNMSSQSAEIEEAEKALQKYNSALGKVQKTAVDVAAVLNDPKSFSTEQIQEAIKQLEEQGKQVKIGDAAQIKETNEQIKKLQQAIADIGKINPGNVYDNLGISNSNDIQQAIKQYEELSKTVQYGGSEWEEYTTRIDKMKSHLAQATEEMKRNELQVKAQQAILNSDRAQSPGTGASLISAQEAKESIRLIEQYKDGLNMSSQSAEIEEAEKALQKYNSALGKVQKTAVDVAAVLNDPKSFSTEQIQEAIKQLEEQGKQVKIGDTAQMNQVNEQIRQLQETLAASRQQALGIDDIVDRAGKGEASILEMEKAVAVLNERLKNTPQNQTQEIERMRQQLDVLNPTLAQTRFSVTRVNETLGNIKGSNIGSLREAAESLETKMKDVNYQMDQFAEDSSKLKAVKEQIKEVEGAWSTTSSQMEKAIDRLKNWVLVYVGFSEAVERGRQVLSDNLALSDSMADVQKTTGLAAEEVARLTELVQSLDTRVSNEKLMEAATEAGRIGLKTQEDVFKFTKSSSIVLTALDELDARAVTSVMKLNGLLGETARLGVDNAMLSTASSINELSQASSAAASPIINFSRRFGGVASQAKINTSQVLALGATLDALGQPVEMSSTAMNKFTTALLSNSKQIAEDTGLSEDYVFQMTRQGKTIELMIEVLSKLNTMGGIGEISKYMGDMGGDGARMTAVIAALASNLGFMRDQLDLSHQAFQDGTSVINEYNVKNENAAALVARMGNDLKEAFVNSQAVAGLTTIVKGMQLFVHFITSGTLAAKAFNMVMLLVIARIASAEKHVKAFNVALTGMWAQMKTSWAQSRALGTSLVSFSGILRTVTAGFRSLGVAIKGVFASNPLGWVAIGVGLLMDLVSWMNKTEDATEDTRSAIERANEAFEEEQYKLTKLSKELEAARLAKKGYADIVSTLNRDYGKHIGYLLSEASGYKEIAGAIDLATAAKRRSILEDEKSNNLRVVQDKYRDTINADIADVKKDIAGSFADTPQEMLKDLYAAVSTDLQSGADKGQAAMGKNVAAVLRTAAKSAATMHLKKAYGFDDEEIKKQDTSKLEQEYFDKYVNRISKIGSITDLAKQYTQKSAELSSLDEELNRQITIQDQRLRELQQKQISIIKEESGAFKGKSTADFTAADEQALEGVAALYDNMLTKIDPKTDAAKWQEAKTKLDETKKLQREVMLAFAENPLKGIKMKVGDDGKLYKEISKNGQIQYTAAKEMSDANLKQLVSAYRKTEEVFGKLQSDENNLMDSKARDMAKSLSKVKTAINAELKKNGIDIDDKGQLKLRNAEYRDGSTSAKASAENREEKEMKKAYEALLKNLQEYFDKRKQVINEGYLSNQMTTEQHHQMLDGIDREHQQVRVNMQSELLGESNNFNEQAYIRDQQNFKKVLGWMGKDTHHFQDTVRADMENGSKKIQENLIKHKEEIEKILLKNQVFETLSRQYQEQLEKLQLFFMKVEDLDKDNFKGMQQRASDVMKMLADAGTKTTDMSYETFRNTVAKYNETSGLLITTQGKDGKTLLKGTEDDWRAIYQIITGYNNDIAETRVRLFNENNRLIEKMLEQDDAYKGSSRKKQSLSEDKTQLGLQQKMGSVGYRDGYEITKNMALQEMDIEEEMYKRRMEMSTEFYNQLIAEKQANGESSAELERMQQQAIQDIQTEYSDISMEKLQSVTEAWIEEYNRRAEKAETYGDKMGEFLGTMASAEWNSVEDRKKAGQELLQYIAQETTEYIKQLLIRMAKEKAMNKETVDVTKLAQKQKTDVTQQGGQVINTISESFGRGQVNIEKSTGDQLTSIAANTAVEGATTSVKKAGVESVAGIAAGSAKTIGELGWWGLPLIAIISAALTALMSTATSSLSSAFGTSTNAGTSNKRLATGMLTYSKGRYPVTGDDGQTYDAEYEPVLQTKVYDGGRGGKAHFGVFSEKMPEMVVSGPTTKLIQENYPWIMDRIMILEENGRLPNMMPAFSRGNVSDFMPGFDKPADMMVDEDGNYVQNPQQKMLMDSLAANAIVIERLEKLLSKGIKASINMYGKDELMEQLGKANKFYDKNKLKK